MGSQKLKKIQEEETRQAMYV